MALSTEHGFIFWLAEANILHGWAMAEQGRNEEAIAHIQEGLAAFRAAGAEAERPQNLSLLAHACMKTGRLDDGLSALTAALAAADEQGNRHYEAETHRLKGELLLKQDDSNRAEAQDCFERAIAIARKQSAKSWELRSTTSLARLLAEQWGVSYVDRASIWFDAHALNRISREDAQRLEALPTAERTVEEEGS